MKNKIKKGWRVLKNKGATEFVRRTFIFLFFFIRSATQNFLLKNKSSVIERLRRFQSDDPRSTFSFIRRIYAGAFGVMQIQEEFLELLEIFKEAAPKVIMEIGTANGGTLFCFSKLAPDDATIISVDLPKGEFGGGYPERRVPLYQAFAKNGQDLHLLREDSHAPETLEKVKEILAGRQVDFLFIDGDHTYEGVKKDFEMYSPLVRNGGVIAFHDIAVHPKESECFVSDFWMDVKHKYRKFSREIIKDKKQQWAGIGLIFFQSRN